MCKCILLYLRVPRTLMCHSLAMCEVHVHDQRQVLRKGCLQLQRADGGSQCTGIGYVA